MNLDQLKGMLSPDTYAALIAHMEHSQKVNETGGVDVSKGQCDRDLTNTDHIDNVNAGVTESFGLSQFWYTKETSIKVAHECLSVGGQAKNMPGRKRIAFVSSPSPFRAALDLLDQYPDTDIMLFEYDERFRTAYGERFCFYDFNHPENLPTEMLGQFDYVFTDPPYLNEHCVGLYTEAMRKLSRTPETYMAFGTGTVVEEPLAKLGFKETNYHPEHVSKLGNDFSVFTTYLSERYGGYAEYQ